MIFSLNSRQFMCSMTVYKSSDSHKALKHLVLNILVKCWL